MYLIGLVYDENELTKEVIDEFKDKNVIRAKYENNKKIRFFRSLFGLHYSPSYKVIVDILAKDKPDVILTIGSMLPPDVKKALSVLDLNIKVVSWVHINLIPYPSKRLKDRISNFILKWIRSKRLKYADAHLAISTGMKNQIVELVKDAKVYTAFNPTEPYNGHLISRSKTPVFLYVERIDDGQKNLSFIFKELSIEKYKSSPA